MERIYQVIKHYADDTEAVVFESRNKCNAENYAEQANYINTEFTYCYYEVR